MLIFGAPEAPFCWFLERPANLLLPGKVFCFGFPSVARLVRYRSFRAEYHGCWPLTAPAKHICPPGIPAAKPFTRHYKMGFPLPEG